MNPHGRLELYGFPVCATPSIGGGISHPSAFVLVQLLQPSRGSVLVRPMLACCARGIPQFPIDGAALVTGKGVHRLILSTRNVVGHQSSQTNPPSSCTKPG